MVSTGRSEGLSPGDVSQLAPAEWPSSGETHHAIARAPVESPILDQIRRVIFRYKVSFVYKEKTRVVVIASLENDGTESLILDRHDSWR